jgi:L-asparaginase
MKLDLEAPRVSQDVGALALSGRRPHIALIATGGTIAGQAQDIRFASQYKAGLIGVADICRAVPGLSDIAHISAEQFVNIDSKDIDLETWKRLAVHVDSVAARPDIDGIVITHGTDTLEETAFLLHLVLETNKPVVVTGAIRPANAMSADGPMNLHDAVTVAAAECSRGLGVLVVVDSHIHSARNVIKRATSGVAAFSSGEQGVLGNVYDDRVVISRRVAQPHTSASVFSMENGLASVEVVLSYGGASCAALEGILSSGTKGVVIAGVGCGSIPENITRRLADASANGVTVVRASRAGQGPVLRNVVDDTLGFIVAGSLNVYKARILLMLALGLRPQIDRITIQDLFNRY